MLVKAELPESAGQGRPECKINMITFHAYLQGWSDEKCYLGHGYNCR